MAGRLHPSRSRTDRTIHHLVSAAVRTLQGRRGDFYTGSSMRGFGAAFHESLGDVFYQLADLLLQKAAESATGTETARGLTLEARQTIEMLKREGETNVQLLDAIMAHNFDYNKKREPVSHLDWSLSTCDSLTGLITATALILPNKKIAEVTPEAVLKKFKSKSFAARTNREMIQKCEEKLDIPLLDYIGIALRAMQGIAEELGL